MPLRVWSSESVTHSASPRTNETECDRALREGRTWDASFACPAARFITEGIFGSRPSTGGASGGW